ncbi:type I phosphodiesterase/nucleotide pyrophosphatase [Algoriphagus boseongensis]|uniref:Type I phosphodiesterase/nucleotide pyrophosphatase n=1 Tax=Algoriphagus boseongensis TaxID=1442587 RepID=A0A4R6T2S6_9BACT|nr:alkaline phosphatase PafA [Algoriphagus boseongensis]TDQ16256.1 type I phosphodiesterase/nucleotide pyrophosphatase [Algoriphagus boseongensis]
MRKVFAVVFALLTISLSALSQQKAEKPKLVVGIIVDQMRQEYLYRFSDRFVEGGFKRFIDQGFMMTNGHYNYIPTYTGPGHASVYTGTTPATHGIIANSWYHKQLGRSVYCAEDSTVTNVGGTPENGKISPRNMLSTTISDEMRFATAMRSKTVGIAIKDRGASLPAGHTGDAYWYDDANGDWMTSTFYHETLPEWVAGFNAKKRPDYYLGLTWETLFPIDTYVNSIADDNDFEGPFVGKDRPTFPYILDSLRANNGGYGLVASTPFGNSLTVDFAMAAIEGEKLGQRGVTDMLAVSFSSPDYIGHRFGPSSVEIEDNYLRLDRDLANFFEYLDNKIGKGQYLVFISADHAVAEVPNYLISQKAPAGNFNTTVAIGQLRGYTQAKYGEGNWILNYSNEQIFLNKDLARDKGVDFDMLQRDIADFSLRIKGVKEAYAAVDMKTTEFTQGRASSLQMGFNHKASGDVLLILESGWLAGGLRGTTHGSGFSYDTHVPVAFYGWGIKHGKSAAYTSITDIAPTIAVMLGVKFPSGTTGQPITEITD